MPTPARSANAAEVLRAVLRHGPIPRSRIAELSGLSPATVTRLYPPLAARGLLRELDAGDGEGGGERGDGAPVLGRPRIPVDLDVAGWAVLGVHLGVRRSVFGALDLRGRLLGEVEIEHADTAPDAVIGRAAAYLRTLRERVAGRRRVLGLGVICGGRVDPEAGVLEEHRGLGWREVDLRAEFARRTGLQVCVDEHVRAMAAAESLFGRARQARSLGYLYVGNAVGFAYAADGAVHRGARSAAGDLAHLPLGLAAASEAPLEAPSGTALEQAPDDAPADTPCTCGVPGCLLALAGERGVARRAARLGIVPAARFELVLEAARAGDGRAERLLRDRAGVVGTAAAILSGILDPELIVVAGGGLTDASEYLSDLYAAARRRAPGLAPAAIAATAFGSRLDAVAAASVVIDRVVRDPLAVRAPR